MFAGNKEDKIQDNLTMEFMKISVSFSSSMHRLQTLSYIDLVKDTERELLLINTTEFV